MLQPFSKILYVYIPDIVSDMGRGGGCIYTPTIIKVNLLIFSC